MLFFHSKVDFTIGLLCERMARQPKVPRLNCVSFFRGVSSSFQRFSLGHSLALFVILSGVSNSISRPKKVQRKGEFVQTPTCRGYLRINHIYNNEKKEVSLGEYKI